MLETTKKKVRNWKRFVDFDREIESEMVQRQVGWIEYFALTVRYYVILLPYYKALEARCNRGNHKLIDSSTMADAESGTFDMSCERCGQDFSGHW